MMRRILHILPALLAAAMAMASPSGIPVAYADEEPVAATIKVEKVAGLPADFMMGVDVSTILAEEASGVVYKNAAGEPTDFFQLLEDAGVNYVRVRIWNDPFDAEGHGYGAGNCTVETAIQIGLRAKAHGMKLLANFHYSDFWADPGKYKAPKAWASLGQTQKEQALYDYTLDSVQSIVDAGVPLGMVQVGNETTTGVAGSTGTNMYKMLARGAAAVRAVDEDILIGVHFTNPERGNYSSIAANLNSNNVDYDVFISSYYPFWHGTLANLTTQLSNVAATYNKLVAVGETSWIYTYADPDGSNSVKSGATSYPVSVQGQATEVRDVIAAVNAVPNGKGVGVFYWEPAWLVVPGNTAEREAKWLEHGSGWGTPYAKEYASDAPDTPEGSGWDNHALFAADGTASDALNVFKYVYSGAYDPDATPEVPVENLLVNPSFEDSNMSAWNFTWNRAQGSVKTRASQPSDAHDGSYIINAWNNQAMDFFFEQTVSGLEPGYYAVSAAAQGETGYNDEIWLYLKDGAASAEVADGARAELAGYGNWALPQVGPVLIESGAATVGMSVKMDASGWAALDDFALVKAEYVSPVVDKTALNSAITQAEALLEADYTPESWSALDDALGTAVTVSADQDATQEAIDQAAEALLAAVGALEEYTAPPPVAISVTQPVLSGSGQVGSTLTVSAVATPADATLAYQWFRGTQFLSQAVSASYVVQPADAGSVLKVKVVASRDGSVSVTKYSNAVAVADQIKVNRKVLPASASVGDTLALDLAYTPVDAAVSVQWFRGTSVIASASGLSYQLAAADSGSSVVAKVTLSLAGYDSVTVYSSTTAVSGPVAPSVKTATLSPAASVAVGDELALDLLVVPEDAGVKLEWFSGTSLLRSGGQPVTGLSYVPASGDVGRDLVVKVTVSMDGFAPVVRYTNHVIVSPAAQQQ